MSDTLQIVSTARTSHLTPRTSEDGAADELKFLRTRVLDCAEGMKTSIRSAFIYRYAAGVAVNQAAKLLGHGNLMTWQKESFPNIPIRTLNDYRNYADTVNEELAKKEGALPVAGKLAGPANLNFSADFATKLLDNKASEEEREHFEGAIREVTMGKTMTEMAREQAVTREAKKPAHHPVKELSPTEKIEAERAGAKARLDAVRSYLATWLADGDLDVERFERHDWELLRGDMIELGKRGDAVHCVKKKTAGAKRGKGDKGKRGAR